MENTKVKVPQLTADALVDYLVEFDPGQLNLCDYTSVLLARA